LTIDEQGQPEQPLTYDSELEVRFAYHAPDDAAKQAHGAVRKACHELAAHIVQYAPQGREQALALTKVEEAMMWANAAIARAPAQATLNARPA
jgi:hypothetical protein